MSARCSKHVGEPDVECSDCDEAEADEALWTCYGLLG